MEAAEQISLREEREGKNPRRLEELVSLLPKAEIHLHLESLVTPKDLLILNGKYGFYPDCTREEQLKEALGIKKIANLTEMVQQFLTIQSFIKAEEDFALIGDSVLPYMERNNIVYLEGFLAVSSFVKRGFDFDAMMESLDASLASIAEKTSRETAVLIDVSRTFGPENAMNNLNLLLAYLAKAPTSRIIGIGLGGAEKSGEPEVYRHVYDKALKEGLRCVAHAGEESPYTQIEDTLKYLRPERIGHGISACQSEEFMEELARIQMPLEVCPTSNIFIKAFVSRMEDHPLATLLRRGILVTLNTDDPLLFEVELVREYVNVYKGTNLTFKEMLILLTNTVKASFLKEEAKVLLLERIDRDIITFLAEDPA